MVLLATEWTDFGERAEALCDGAIGAQGCGCHAPAALHGHP